MILVVSFPKQLTYPKRLWPTPARLDDDNERESLFAAIIEHGSVTKACEALAINRPCVYRYASQNKDFDALFLKARAIAAEALYDECITIADTDKMDPRDKHVRIETRMRVAGKLIPRLSDKPLAQINVDNRSIVITEDKRAELQDRLAKLQLRDRNDDK